MKNKRILELSIVVLYLITNFLMGLNVFVKATNIIELIDGWSILTIMNCGILLAIYIWFYEDSETKKNKCCKC